MYDQTLTRRIKRLCACMAILVIGLGWSAPPANSAISKASLSWKQKIDPALLNTPQDGTSEFIVYMKEQSDLSGASALAGKAEKGQFVYQALTGAAYRSQLGLLAYLAAQGVPYRSFWITNSVWVRGTTALAGELAARPDVQHVYGNYPVAMHLPPQDPSAKSLAPAGIEWNIVKVGADQAWMSGVTGQGVVVAGADTGVMWDHPALMKQYRGWDGVIADHNYNWHDAIQTASAGNLCGSNTQAPCDDYIGHGTHTMGTMVGEDGSANQIGMAPGARWIGCRNMDAGVGKPSTYMDCFQFFLAPTDLSGNNPRPDLAPDVINNSWSCTPSEGCALSNPNILSGTIQSVAAAGIVVVASASNNGPKCSTINSPPGIYPQSLTVGATNLDDTIAGFSSRGPVTVIDGSILTKPNVSAPGSGVRSSVPPYVSSSLYAYKSGTSMAAPHVAGLVALLLSAEPSFKGRVSFIESWIEQTAVPLYTSEGCGEDTPVTLPNNTFGYGRIHYSTPIPSYFPIIRR